MNRDYWQLRTASRNYYDAYRLTTRISNRLRALARSGEAFDIDLHAQLEVAEIMKGESQVILRRIYKSIAPPAVRKFQRETVGLGEVWLARLIGEVGDFVLYSEAWWETPKGARVFLEGEPERDAPYDEDDPLLEDGGGEFEDDEKAMPKRVLVIGEVRTTGVRELWAYCGHGDASRRRRRGQTQAEALASGNPTAKMIVHQMAEFALRSNGKPDKNGKERRATPYYPCYLAARAHVEELHPDWRPGHVYNHAVRIVGKAILKDLWRVQHGEPPAYGARTEWAPRARPQERKSVPVRASA